MKKKSMTIEEANNAMYREWDARRSVYITAESGTETHITSDFHGSLLKMEDSTIGFFESDCLDIENVISIRIGKETIVLASD